MIPQPLHGGVSFVFGDVWPHCKLPNNLRVGATHLGEEYPGVDRKTRSLTLNPSNPLNANATTTAAAAATATATATASATATATAAAATTGLGSSI